MVYACPGDTLEMTLDPTKRKREEAFTWDGTGLSGEVTKLYDKIRTTYCDFPEGDNIHEKGPDSLMTWKDLQVACLDEMIRKMNTGLPELEGCSPLASDILRTYIISQHLEHICRYYMLTDMENIDRETYWQQFFSFVAPREKYLLDNPLLMIAGEEFFFNYVEYTVMRPMHGRVLNYMPFDYDPQIAEAIAQEKVVYSREFRRNAMNKLNDKLNISPTDFSAQVCQLRDVFNTLDWHGDNYDQAADEVAAAMSVISHPELIRRAVLTYRDYVKEKEAKVVEQKPMTKGDSIFQRIIEPYKGNVLYVDFWEMSCGPCRATMLHMRDEVEANMNKPVKYLYITDDTPEKCSSFLEPNKIRGEHIFITRSEWGYLQEKFQFSGIPFVLLFDKKGNQRENVTVEQLLNEAE
jgi:AhpC/TSA family.